MANIWQSSNDSVPSILSALTYYDNPIQDCVINSIEVDLEALDRTGVQIVWSEWGATLRGYATCSISTASGHITANLTTVYDYVPASASFTSGLYSLISLDQEARASMWWGAPLLSMYWVYLGRTMQNIRENATANDVVAIRKATLYLTPSAATIRSSLSNGIPPDSKPTNDITDLDYFDVDYCFVVDNGSGDLSAVYPGGNDFPTTLSNLNYHQAYPNIWIQAGSAAKSFYSTILTDLGQVSSTYPNILTNATSLQHFTSNFSMITDPNLSNTANAPPGPVLQDYDTLKSQTWPLGTTPAVISTKYLCQVPRRKAGGTLFVAIFVADLVFLQALWKIFTLATDTWLLTKKKWGPQVTYCEGCLERKRTEGHGLAEMMTPRSLLDRDDAGFEELGAGRGSRQSLIGSLRGSEG